ncbi:MAG TPA: FG-GAP-like repeat-containing protein [Humisphaera sp.]
MRSQHHPRRRVPAAPVCEPVETRLFLSSYTVTGLGDGPGAVRPVGDGRYAATTLRAAVVAANARAGADRIEFAAGLRGRVSLATALPAITGRLAVAGPGAARLTVARSATAADRFAVFAVAAGAIASISGLTITGGTGVRTGEVWTGLDEDGGGVWNLGDLALARCAITGNAAGWGGYVPDTARGGGVYSGPGARLALTDSTVSGNSATAALPAGGGVFNAGVLVVRRSTVADNVVNYNGDRGGQAAGAGIFNAPTGTLTVVDSTVSGNTGDIVDGGGLANNGTATLVNSTVYGNHAGGISGFETGVMGGHGGAVFNEGWYAWPDDGSPPAFHPAALTLRNCTVAANTANGGGTGGVRGDGAVALFNSLLVGNTDADPAYGDEVTPSDLGASLLDPNSAHNVIGTGAPAWMAGGKNGNRTGVTPAQAKLGPLADNGGPTRTVALLAGSAAIDAGATALAVGPDGAPLAADQRGRPRVGGAAVDAGAFEATAVVRFYLVDAARDRRLFELKDGATIKLGDLPTRALSIEAVTSPGGPGSVRFDLDGVVRTENLAPYALFGSRGDDVLGGAFAPGAHRLTATPFTGRSGTGAAGVGRTVRFTVKAPRPAATFDPARVILRTSRMASGPLVADVDGDGRPDVVAGTCADGAVAWPPDGRVEWFRNEGGGRFAAGRPVTDTAWYLHGMSLAAADVDGDGRTDVVCASDNKDDVYAGLSAGKVSWFRNLGAGRFGPERPVVNGVIGAGSVRVADVDRDGDPDLVVASLAIEEPDSVLWFENRGHGSAWGRHPISAQAGDYGGLDTRAIAVADVDGDGWIDVARPARFGPNVAWYRNPGTRGGGWTLHEAYTFSMVPNAIAIAAADFNGDGRVDLASGDETYDSGGVYWYPNKGGGTFPESRVVAEPTFGGLDFLFPADVDGDGDADLLAVSTFDCRAVWFRNDGRGGFGREQLVARLKGPPSNLHTVSAADFDGDGRVDVLVSDPIGGTVAWYRQR